MHLSNSWNRRDQGLSIDICPCIKDDVRNQFKPTKCTSFIDISQQSCFCTNNFYPDDYICLIDVIDLHHFYKDYTPPDCLCPKRAEELDGIESRDCKCIPQNLRDECKTPETVDCTKTPSDPSFPPVDGQIDCRKFPDDAACTEECKYSTEQTKEECACIVGDKR